MIPIIGGMIGMYILVRCASFLARKGERSEAAIVKILAILAILSTLVGMMLLNAGSLVALPGLIEELGH